MTRDPVQEGVSSSSARMGSDLGGEHGKHSTGASCLDLLWLGDLMFRMEACMPHKVKSLPWVQPPEPPGCAQELAVQGLRSNMQQVEQCVAEAVQQLQQPSDPPQRSPLETCQLVEGWSEAHQAVLLPRLEGYEAACARFCQRCLDGKVGPCTVACLCSIGHAC